MEEKQRKAFNWQRRTMTTDKPFEWTLLIWNDTKLHKHIFSLTFFSLVSPAFDVFTHTSFTVISWRQLTSLCDNIIPSSWFPFSAPASSSWVFKCFSTEAVLSWSHDGKSCSVSAQQVTQQIIHRYVPLALLTTVPSQTHKPYLSLTQLISRLRNTRLSRLKVMIY